MMNKLTMYGRVGCLVALCALAGCRDEAAQQAADNTKTTITATLTPLLLEPLTTSVSAFVGADNQRHLVYELTLHNLTAQPVQLGHLDIVGQDGQSIARLSADEVAARLQTYAGDHADNELGAGQMGLLFLHLSLPAQADGEAQPPIERLTHTLWTTFVTPQGVQQLPMSDQGIAVKPLALPVLGAPLKGERFIAGDGCCNSTRHVRAALPINSKLRLAQRYAIDWEQLDAHNKIFEGAANDVNNYHIYGQPVLAVTDATVVAAVDGEPDQVPGAFPEGLSVNQADGNHIILDLGAGFYALYAHLKPNSVQVKAGDRVTRGQVLGQVGNSGNTLEPHLHFHVMDAPSGLVANGLPYVIDAFELSGTAPLGTADFDAATSTGSAMKIEYLNAPQPKFAVLPMDLNVVNF